MISSNIILDEGLLRDLAGEFLRHDEVFYDVETVGEHRGVPHLNTITWLGMATDGITVEIPMGHPIGTRQIGTKKEPRTQLNHKTGKSMVKNFTVPVYEEPPDQLSASTVFGILTPVFMSERISKISHGNFDPASVQKYLPGPVARPFECNIVLDWLCNENLFSYKLKDRIRQLWKVEYEDKNAGKAIEEQPFGKAARYLHIDTKYGWLQYKRNRPQIEAQGLEAIYDLELDILEVMVAMRLRGARIDEDILLALHERLAVDLEDCEVRLYQAAGKRFNINSTPQKQEILFGSVKDGNQGLKGWKLTDAGQDVKESGGGLEPRHYSTDAEALENYTDNPVVATLLEYQDINKLQGTYVESWLGVPPDPTGTTVKARKGKPCQIYDGRIHADFVQFGTKTGRFSCREPNLQNIPRGDTEHGKMLRDAFWADEDWILVTADYGQIEPRFMAHFLGQGMLYEGFLKGMDPYIVNAAAALGKDPGDITKAERQTYGKTMFLAMGYGLGFRGLAVKFGVSEARAKQIIARHEGNMPEVPAYKEQLIRKAKAVDGVPHIRTILGRKRRVPELLSTNKGLKARAERQLFNSLIQGSSADLMKLAMVRTYNNLRAIPGAYIALTVHDELICCAPKDRADDAAQALQDGMTGPEIQKLIRVPLKADVVIGQRWGDCK